MKKILIILLLLGLKHIALAQNLVKNPSFEDYIQCPTNGIDFDGYVSNWLVASYRQPSYRNACAVNSVASIPYNGTDYQYARTGNAMTLLSTYYYTANGNNNYRQYIEVDLLSALKQDSIYEVSFYVNLTHNSTSAIREMGAYLSDSFIYDNVDNYPSSVVLDYLSPQIEHHGAMLADSIGWTKICGLYKAHGGERYITIGCFRNDNYTSVLNFYPPPMLGATYYNIDDVCVRPVPNIIQALDLGSDSTICGSMPTRTLSAPLGFEHYSWSTSDTIAQININQAGVYSVTCEWGCGLVADTIQFNDAAYSFELPADTTICKGSLLTISAPLGADTYLWSNGVNSHQIQVNSAGNYSLTATNYCGSVSDMIKVSIDSVPTQPYTLPNTLSRCQDNHNVSVILRANRSDAPNYTWNTGEQTSYIAVDSAGRYVVSSYYPCGTYTDTCIVSDCPPNPNYHLYAPNAFSPDSDGINDYFGFASENVDLIQLNIYDRWGARLYSSNIISWDGTVDNKPLPTGVYIWQVLFKKPVSGTFESQQGMVVLVR